MYIQYNDMIYLTLTISLLPTASTIGHPGHPGYPGYPQLPRSSGSPLLHNSITRPATT